MYIVSCYVMYSIALVNRSETGIYPQNSLFNRKNINLTLKFSTQG
jgi:hypothetical protein